MPKTPSRDWRKRSHRLCESRDEFKARNREKAAKIKALEGTASDLEQSRAQWKKKCEKKTQEIKTLKNEIAEKDALIEAERILRQQEAAAHVEELEDLKKKWQMLQQSSLGKEPKKSLVDTIRQLLS
jgi:chromosome segregation ATPase